MLSSFRSRLVLSNLLLMLIGLLVLGGVFTRVLAERNKEVKERDLAADAQLIARQIENIYRLHLTSPSSATEQSEGRQLTTFSANASRTLKLRVIVVSPSGVIRFDSQSVTPYDHGSWHPLDQRALARAESTKHELQSSDKVVLQSPILGTVQRNGGAVQLVAGIGDVRPGLSALGNVILTVVGTAIVVWLLIGLYFTYSVSRPLLAIATATRRMAQGDYAARVHVAGKSEIARLGASFNAMAQQVEKSDRVLRDFVANVAHDLRTPLTMIIGFSQALLDGTAAPDEVAPSAEVIHEESLKMQRMVDDLLQLTRLESGLSKFRRQPVEVRPFVQSVMDRTARAHAGQQVARMVNRVPPGIPQMEVDREHLERALRNLLDNALQYTPVEGTVTVNAAPVGRGWVEISVTDTGVGIPQKDLSRVFERFYRTDRARERAKGHSGLGLAIVREIVEAQGGRISVESTEGKGTTFRFTAPQAAHPGSPAVSPAPTQRAATREF